MAIAEIEAQAITVKIIRSKKDTYEDRMEGFNKLSEYILKNIDEHKPRYIGFLKQSANRYRNRAAVSQNEMFYGLIKSKKEFKNMRYDNLGSFFEEAGFNLDSQSQSLSKLKDQTNLRLSLEDDPKLIAVLTLISKN